MGKRMRLIREGGSVITDADVSPTDAVAAPPGTTMINPDHYDALVEAVGDEDELHASLGVVTMDYSTMPLAKLQKSWKRKVEKQAETAFALKWSLFDVALGTANMKTDATAYKAALKTTKDAITACTTNEAVILISFVPPA
jgi:hypothetical protein